MHTALRVRATAALALTLITTPAALANGPQPEPPSTPRTHTTHNGTILHAYRLPAPLTFFTPIAFPTPDHPTAHAPIDAASEIARSIISGDNPGAANSVIPAGNTLFVNADPDTHKDIAWFIANLTEDTRHQQRELAAAAAALRDARLNTINTIENELENLLDEIAEATRERGIAKRTITELSRNFSRRDEEPDSAETQDVNARYDAANNSYLRLTTRIDDATALRAALHARLIELHTQLIADEAIRAEALAAHLTHRLAPPPARLDAFPPVNPDDYRRPDGTVDYEALREAARQRAHERHQFRKQFPNHSPQDDFPNKE